MFGIIKVRPAVRHLKALLSMAIPQGNGHMVEIGSYAGESAKIFLDSGRLDRLWCVDPWAPGYDEKDSIAYSDLLAAEQIFDQRVGSDGRVMKLRMTSIQAVDNFKDGSLDFVYIDGNHKYEFVRDDIALYLPKVKQFIGGHDYNLPAVRRAVDEAFSENQLQVFGQSWLYGA